MRDSPGGECKCWKLSCEHIALSVMCHFLVGSQELYFPSFLCCSRLQACHYTWLIFENLARAPTPALTHARAYYERRKVWQTARWRGRPVGSGHGAKDEGLPNLLQPAAPGSAEASCQLLCLPKGLDTVAQLAPAGPWQQPGEQPEQRKKAAKKVTNNRELSLRASWLPATFYQEHGPDMSQPTISC